ncbi:MAG TPA: HAMP domain-containing sensor histidine kinase [Candidatus Limnocylindria bacterium]|jgi:signal transduction histidine kinase
MKGQPLSVRLALLLAVAVVAVLLLGGVVVNQLVSRSLEDELSAAQRDRVELLAQQLASFNLPSALRRPGAQLVLDRIARSVGGRLQVVDSSGAALLTAGAAPDDGAAASLEEPIAGTPYTLLLDVPSATRPFLRVFNITLLVAGVLAVIALVVVAALLSDRLTRPLRGVAAAARRLGAGDLSARAEGGSDRESSELADAFNNMAARLEQSETLRRRAASDAAHDLATPATVLESQLQAMLDGVVPADAEQLGHARAAAGALSSVVAQLRDLVDVEAAPILRKPAPVAVIELVGDAQLALEPLFRDRRISLTVEVAATLMVTVDRAQVSRALRNVLTNAAQHAPEGSEVSVVAEAAAEAVVIRVTDAGPGIAHEDAPHVFERFYRADRARSGGAASAGSGIGLTIARELVRANHGDVRLEASAPGRTVFAIQLPPTG